MSSKWAYKDLPRLPVQALIHNGYSDPYEPGTKRARAYMAGISSIYQDDCIEDAAIVAGNTMKELISETQDAEFELDELS
jgi:hypothetical protein